MAIAVSLRRLFCRPDSYSRYHFPDATNDQTDAHDTCNVCRKPSPDKACSTSETAIMIESEWQSVWKEAVRTHGGPEEVNGIDYHEHESRRNQCDGV